MSTISLCRDHDPCHPRHRRDRGHGYRRACLALSLGTDLGGNATPIGASANVVGTSASAKGGYPIGWGRYCKYCVPATIIVMAVSTAYLFLRYL